ncbi:MAG: DegT/DnrJ/EryC1/StrS family aminotransferase [Flavobacteriia bacterium]|nr:DegT/DnrJ/EryC1/StrS family aminotransferase [Flavobacteriia bacterium]
MVKFLDLKAINAPYIEEYKERLASILESGWVLLGNHLSSFEAEFANYCGARHCIGVANGLEAIRLILEAYKALGVMAEGDEVIVPSNTYIATILGIEQAGLKPVLVEPDVRTYNLDPNLVEMAVTSRTKAIFTVHLYGQLSDMSGLKAVADEHVLLLLDDAAQSHGAIDEMGRVGSSSEATAFSFYPGKNLGAIGDGGGITTSNDELARTIYALRNYGSEKKYHNKFKGWNSRLDELQASFLSAKLKNLDSDNDRRREAAKRYLAEIVNPHVSLPYYNGTENHVFHLFVVRVEDRDKFVQHLTNEGVQTLIHYPIPPHHQEAYAEWKDETFPISEEIHRTIVSLPISPVMPNEDIDQVINAVNSYSVQ